MKEKLINFIADSFGGLSYKLIPYFIFQLALTALLVWIIDFTLRKRVKENDDRFSFIKTMLISIVFCMLTFFAHYSLSLAVFWGIVSGFLILKMTIESKSQFYATIISIGLACGVGSGFVIPTIISFALIWILIVLSTKKLNQK